MKNKKIHVGLFIAFILAFHFLAGCTKPTDVPATPEKSYSKNLAVSTAAIAPAFKHPGILNTQQSLDYVAQQVNNGDLNRNKSYNYLLSYCDSKSNKPSGGYKSVVYVQAGALSADEIIFKGDALLAYGLALRWAKTGNASYANTVRDILIGWASKFTKFDVINDPSGKPTPYNQTYLEASWAAANYVAAAEIIKNYVPASGIKATWSAQDNVQFTSFINNLKDNYINYTEQVGYNNNWNVSAGWAKIAIGIFEDNQTVYQNGITIIKNVLQKPNVINTDGSMSEVCSHSDFVHYQYSLTGLSYASNTCGIQGDLSLYSAENSKLLKGFQFQYNLMKKNIVPSCTVRGSATSPIWPGIFVADRHYNTAETNFIAANYKTDPNGLPGQDLGFLAWTDYTHYKVPLTL